MLLFVNCCLREESRTLKIATALLKKLGEEYEEINLYKEDLKPLSLETLNMRSELIEKGDFSHPIFNYANQFASADTIVISAPYWDLSFPAMLKNYIENIYITGIVSKYASDGTPIGLCKAKKLYYVTTAGGPYEPEYSFGYIKSLATRFFGIKEAELIKAEMLDVYGFSAEDIVNDTIKKL